MGSSARPRQLPPVHLARPACRFRPGSSVRVVRGHTGRPHRRSDMTQYAIHFNQQWVGDHPAEWFQTRVEPSTAVVRDMESAGVLVFAGGLEEDMSDAFSADATSGTVSITDGPYTETTEYLGGITIIDVPDLETARMWAGRVAEGCGWPQEVRVIR